MLCAVYKTLRKEGMYLYLPKKDNFNDVPESLMKSFGKPQFVMLVAVEKHAKVAGVHADTLKKALAEEGYYLQMPAQLENWLGEHRESLGLPRKVEE
ncbi:YcgL domain-containing protein [Alteromonas sp. ASW11-130]|uniref:YcgL domain-containing protein n=1 Tax=Alteromonas sp. ASW11-130 TaxID=3015775 RepID=UPI002242934A|nr:YcgL domain-containing protein [Alteromonas sp. ASW11-130]MCW8092548.1 YcgL domain-containing protein [Alteromonas sp. ASW11-130]